MRAMYFHVKSVLARAGGDRGDPLVYGAVLNQAAASQRTNKSQKLAFTVNAE